LGRGSPALKAETAERLAKAARCSVRTVKNWRNGHTEPSPKVRRRLERTLARLQAERESGQGKTRRSRHRKR
jgi:ribosome-binding protein aMBF1 (putative translation factor)